MRLHGIRYAVLDPCLIKGRVVRNPNYGGPALSLNGWRYVELSPATRKRGFFEALRKSVTTEGFRNPVLVYALPEGLFLSFGASRVRVAQETNTPVPAIINDYAGAYDHEPEVTPLNVDEFFVDPPLWREFNEDGFDYHYSLERNRRQWYDPQGMNWTDELDDTDFIKKEFPWL